MSLGERKRLQDRFIVYRLNEDSPVYEIYDRTHDREACISEETIGDPRFNPALWYARRCCREQNLDESSEIAHWAIGRFVGETAIGRSLERRIQDSLARGAPYLADISVPIDPKVARFGVELDSTTTHLRHYLVIDRHLELTSYLPASRVRDPRFNAASWYEFELEARFLRFPFTSKASDLMWTANSITRGTAPKFDMYRAWYEQELINNATLAGCTRSGSRYRETRIPRYNGTRRR
ncbi:hypothetical protein DFP72DRAFT_554486 [Ephemerocybe angulata]|uniref:Uncharacterized protein n=1 Tax=Ephemerocybe angulata TaxID=980116 RepID=A0A8H6M0J2_9AGAR|nr:hypothetical protein DFP72DRAFT_554486 [Tulosesus angulatus]